jgi:hypothetical protein
VKDIFYHTFEVGFKAHIIGYKGVKWGCTTLKQIEARDRAIAKVCAKGHVVT